MKDILSSKPVIQPDPTLYESSSPRSPKDALKYLIPQVRPYGRVKSPYSSDPRTPKQKKFVAKQKSLARRGNKSSATKSLENQISRGFDKARGNKGYRTSSDFSHGLESKPSAARKVQFSASKGTQSG